MAQADILGLSRPLEELLSRAGWRSSLTLEAAFDDEAGALELITQLSPFSPGAVLAEWQNELWAWKISAVPLCRLKRARLARVDMEVRSAVLLAKVQVAAERFAELLTEKVVAACTASRWRTSRLRLLAAAASEGERAAVEKKERAKWMAKLVDILQEAALPVIRLANTSVDPAAALENVAGSRRSKTIRSRVRRWEKVSLWLKISFGISYPETVGQMLDYLFDLRDGGCARSVPDHVAAAWAFVEKAGGVKLCDRLTDNVLWVRNVQAVKATLLEGNTQTKKAPQYTVSMLISLEIVVANQGYPRPKYIRALAWLKLVKVCCSLRFDDTMGFSVGRMRMTRAGLVGVLAQTKDHRA